VNEKRQKRCPLKSEWIEWWREWIRVIQDQGQIAQTDGVIYRIDKKRKTIILVHGEPRERILAKRCIEACGYKYDEFPDPTAAAIVAIAAKDPQIPMIAQLGPGLTFTKGVEPRTGEFDP